MQAPKMEFSFAPTPDVAVILNALLDKFENRAKRITEQADRHTDTHAQADNGTSQSISAGLSTLHSPRSIKIFLANLPLPSYFSQIDPEPRLIANKQFRELARHNFITLTWLRGETNHILECVSLANGTARSIPMGYATQHDSLYKLLQRTPASDQRARLESLLLSERFRYPKEDWRARVLIHTLQQLRAGKSSSPFSLTDSNLNLDLLAVLQALPTLTAETPYRVFSVHVFNDSKRFEDLKPALVRLARRANPEWKLLTSEDLLHELNLVANPGYIHLAGNWELTDINGQVINLDSFTPSVGFPASQIASIRHVAIRAKSLLCIENLTPFHEFPRANSVNFAQYATICLMGNPSPAIRHLLRLIPTEIPIYLWSDMDYGGFNILSQLRKQVNSRIQPYLMDIATLEKYAHLSRPLTQADTRNLKRLAFHPLLKDVLLTIEHLLKRGLKLEQEAIQI